MTKNFSSANSGYIFQSRNEIEDHLHAKINTTVSGKVGTEIELFVTSPEGHPATFDQVEMLLDHIADAVPGTQKSFERGRTIALDIPHYGAVTLEPGCQVELGTKPCDTLAELEAVNRGMRQILNNAAETHDLRVSGAGHNPRFQNVEQAPRARFTSYQQYFQDEYGPEKGRAMDSMKTCCGLQVNVDPMGKDFHEIYRSLMLMDLATSFSMRSTRQATIQKAFADVSPEQTTPLFEAQRARSNEDVVGHIVDRLMTIKLPFIPNETGEENRLASSVFGHVPRIGEVLEAKRLSGRILDNALSLQLQMPNLRRHGVVETRAPDSVDTLEELMGISRRYHAAAYDPGVRRTLLETFEQTDPRKLATAYAQRFDISNINAMDIGNGKCVGDLIDVTGVRSAVRQEPRLVRAAFSPRISLG